MRRITTGLAALAFAAFAVAPAGAVVGVSVDNYSGLSGNFNYAAYNLARGFGYDLTGAQQTTACRIEAPCTASWWIDPAGSDPTATAASAFASMSDVDQGGFSTGAGFARANLSTAELGASADGTFRSAFGIGSGISVRASAAMNDLLNFTVEGATASTVTQIGVSLRLDGQMSQVNPFTGASARSYLAFGGATFDGTIGFDQTGAVGLVRSGAGGWASYDITPTVDGVLFSGLYELRGPTAALEFGEFLDVRCGNGATCDYANTASFSLSLPDNVTFTSRSGVFLTGVSAIPEPGTWALMIAGFGLVGGVRRRLTRTIGAVGLKRSVGTQDA